MYGQSLQAHELLGGAGMNVFSGLDFCIWCSIPVSVATINSLLGFSCVNFKSPVVLPI